MPEAATSSAEVRVAARDRYDELVVQAIDLAERISSRDVADALRGLTQDAFGPLRVGLVGEQAVKARLLNAFLGHDALDPVRGQRRVRRIVAGPTDQLTFRTEPPVTLGLAPESWMRADAMPLGVDLDVQVDSDALREADVALVDIPMSAAVYSADGWRALQRCHVAMLVVEASSMVTRPEADLLRNLHERVGPPCVSVWVTGMARVAAAERDDVLRGIRRVVRRNAASTRVRVVDAPEPLRSALSALAAQYRTDEGRTWQLEARLRTAIGDLLRRADEQLALARAALADDSAAREALERRHAREYELVRGLRMRRWQRAAERNAAIGQEIVAGKADAARQLRASLAHASDARGWCNETASAQISESVARISAAVDRQLGVLVAEELEWARRELGAAGLTTMATADVPPPPMAKPPMMVLPEDRTARLRLLGRLSGSVLRILGPAIAAQGLASKDLERLPEQALAPALATAEGENKRLAWTVASAALRRALEELSADAEERVRAFYSDLFSVLTEEVERRNVSATTELDRGGSEERVAELNTIIADLRLLSEAVSKPEVLRDQDP